MRYKKVKYTENFESNLTLLDSVKLKQVYILKDSILAIYEAVLDDAKGGPAITMQLRLEYPKRLLPKFKLHFPETTV